MGREVKEIEATFKWDDQAADGEDVGPLILWDKTNNEFYGELAWMRLSEARELAKTNGWHFSQDGSGQDDPPLAEPSEQEDGEELEDDPAMGAAFGWGELSEESVAEANRLGEEYMRQLGEIFARDGAREKGSLPTEDERSP